MRKIIINRYNIMVAMALVSLFFMTSYTIVSPNKAILFEKAMQQEPTDNKASLSQIENQAFDLVNDFRKGLNLPLLIRNEVADNQCRIHSQDMAQHKVGFGHEGATTRLKNIGKTLSSFEGGGENVFECSGGFQNPAKEAFEGWLHSKGHRENMVGRYNLAGIGVAKAANGDYYFTQIFIKGN